MSPRTKEQFSKIREESKAKILKAALVLFGERGYHASSISQIAKEAKVSQGLLYNYFASKDELLEQIIESALQEFERSMMLTEIKGTPREKIENLLRVTFEMAVDNLTYWKLFFSMAMQPEVTKRLLPNLQAIRLDFRKSYMEIFTNWGSTEPENDTNILLGHIDGMIINYMIEPDTFDLHATVDRILDYYDSVINRKVT